MHTIYSLPAYEFDRYRTHLLMLDKDSRYMRFGFQIKDDGIETLIKKWKENTSNHKIFVVENDNLDIVGVAHVSLDGTPVELAFSVLKECQGQGIGDALMKRAIEYCQNQGIKQGCMVCLGSNNKIKNLARKNNVLVTTEDGDSYGQVEIPNLTAISIWKEYWDDNIAKIDHYYKKQRKFTQMFKFPLNF